MLSAAIVTWRLELWDVGLSIPFRYGGDAITGLVYTKAMLDNGWYTHNSYIGMPTGWVLYDYPGLHTIDFIIMKILSVFLGNYALLVNSYYLLTFPLVAISAVFALRQIRLSYSSAVVAAVLYSLIPYHFMRGEGHLFLSAYYIIPMAVMLAMQVGNDSEVWRSLGALRSLFNVNRFRLLCSVLACALIALADIYFIFFSIYTLMVSGLSATLSKRRKAPFVSACGLIVVILLVSTANHLPVFAHSRAHGSNPSAVQRGPREALRLGLEINGLVIPMGCQGIPTIDQVLSDHRVAHRGRRLNPGNYLGLVGVIGLLILFVEILKMGSLRRSDSRLRQLSIMNIWLLLLATVGNLGYLFALLVTPKIRAYDRITVVIAFLAIAAFFIVLDSLGKRLSRGKAGRAAFFLILGAFLVTGIFDQTAEGYMRGVSNVLEYETTKQQYKADAAFIRGIESRVPKNSMVFQLPHHPWPETKRHKMGSYDHLMAYLHSKSLRWSFGAMRDRPGDLWLRKTSTKKVNKMVESLCLMGFAGVYIDRYGYADSGEKIVARLRGLLHQEPLESEGGRLVFFQISEYSNVIRNQYGLDEWERKRAKEHLQLSWRRGFYGMEKMATNSWRWCQPCGELWIHNLSDRTIECTLVMSLGSPQSHSSQLVIDSKLFRDSVELSREPQLLENDMVVPPGDHVITFKSDAPNAARKGAKRFCAFQVIEPGLSGVHWCTREKNRTEAQRINGA